MSTQRSDAFKEYRGLGIAPKTNYKYVSSGSSVVKSVDDALGILERFGGGGGDKPVLGSVEPIPCPCCAKPTNAPTMLIVVDYYGVTNLEQKILGAVWRGKGHPVQTERIFDAMYIDDPNGGPAPTQMYRAFKIALCRLRKRLVNSGVSIENVGYRRGYRLTMKEL